MLDEDKVIQLYRELGSISAVAKRLNVSYQAIWFILNKRGVWKRRKRSEIEQYKDDIIRMYIDEGKSAREIAEILGLTEKQVAYGLAVWGCLKRRVNVVYDEAVKLEENADELWELVLHWQRVKEKQCIKRDEVEVELETELPYVGIAFMSDLHVGSKHTDYKRLREDLELIKSEEAVFVMLLGDLIDNFVIPEIRSFDEILTPSLQRALILDVARQLSGKCIAALMGDHEAFSKRVDDYNFMKEIVETLGCPFLGFKGVVNLIVGEQFYRIAVAHRYRFNSSFNLTHTAKRLVQNLYDADIAVVAHHHQADIEEAWLQGKWRIFIRTGSYKGCGDYAEKKGFVYTGVSVPIVLLNTKEREMFAFRDLEKGIKILKALNRCD